MNKKSQYKLNYLSEQFYSDYPASLYSEIEEKFNRPYMVMLVKIGNNMFAIPFRTNVKHPNCYKFRSSSRHTDSTTGLDYSKAVIVNDEKYIGLPARINDKEYIELNDKCEFIIKSFKTYLKGYLRFASGKADYAFHNYQYTTLKYFHKELGIE